MGAGQQERKLKTFSIGMYGMISGLWDLFGESSFATIGDIGSRILAKLEKENKLQIKGETPEDVLLEVSQVLKNELGAVSDSLVTVDGNKVSMACTNCFLKDTTAWLEADGVQPFACMPMNISAAALKKQLGVNHHLLGRDWDENTQTCTIHFELV